MALDIKLYKFQHKALFSPANEVLMGGAAGPGKSYGLRIIAILLALECPGINIYFFRRLFRELMLNHVHSPNGFQNLMKEMLDSGDVVLNKSEGTYHFWNGSKVYLCHAQHEDDVKIYLGTDMHVLLIDEATQFTEKMIRFLRTRVRLGGFTCSEKWIKLLPRIIYATNPGGPSHRYFKHAFVNHGPYKVHTAPDHDGGMTREYIPALYLDNKIAMANDPDYAKRIMGLGDPNLVAAYLKGNWDLNMDSPFGELWDAEVHVIDSIEIPATWTIDRSHDHGTSAPAATLYCAESDGCQAIINDQFRTLPKRSIVVFSELYFANKEGKGLGLTPVQLARRMKSHEQVMGLVGRCQAGPADTAIFDHAPGYASIHDNYVNEGIRFVKADKKPGSRVRGVLTMKQMLMAARMRSTDQPHIYFVRNGCPNTISQIPDLSADQEDPDDIDSSSEDHIWDALRYRILKSLQRAGMGQLLGA